MQPCPYCGAFGLDPYGTCLTCGSYLGQPVPAPRRTPVVPLLIALGVVVVLMAGALTAILVARSTGGPTAVASTAPTGGPGSPTGAEGPTGGASEPTGEPSTTAPADPLHDPCVIGAWRETSSQADIDWDGGKVRLTSAGTTQTFKPDGTVVADYGAGITRTGKANGHTYQNIVKGQLRWNWQTDRGQILYSNPTGSGTSVFKRDGRQIDSNPLKGGVDPERYTCTSTQLREFGPDYTIELTRIGPAA